MNVTYSCVAEEVEEKPTFMNKLAPETAVVFKMMTQQGIANKPLLEAFTETLSTIKVSETNQEEVMATIEAIKVIGSTLGEREDRKDFYGKIEEKNKRILLVHDSMNPRISTSLANN